MVAISLLAGFVIAAASRTDPALADGEDRLAALAAGYHLAFLLTAALLIAGAVNAALLQSRRAGSA